VQHVRQAYRRPEASGEQTFASEQASEIKNSMDEIWSEDLER
jgi:hypothetical protein